MLCQIYDVVWLNEEVVDGCRPFYEHILLALFRWLEE